MSVQQQLKRSRLQEDSVLESRLYCHENIHLKATLPVGTFNNMPIRKTVFGSVSRLEGYGRCHDLHWIISKPLNVPNDIVSIVFTKPSDSHRRIVSLCNNQNAL